MKTIKTMMMLGIAAMVSVAAPAFAQTAAVLATFGVVDMNRVMKTTDAAKDVFGQFESKRKEFQTTIAKEEQSLRADEQELVKQKDKLSKEEFEKRRKEFEGKLINGQKLVQDRKRILDEAINKSGAKLRSEAAKIVAEIAKERNYSAVFTQDAVMISAPTLDMTDDVVARMNKNVKKIAVEWQAPAVPAKK